MHKTSLQSYIKKLVTAGGGGTEWLGHKVKTFTDISVCAFWTLNLLKFIIIFLI